MDLSIDILKTLSLVNAGGAAARSGDHAKGAVRGQRMLPKRGRAVARSRGHDNRLGALEFTN